MVSLTINQAHDAVYKQFTTDWAARTVLTFEGEAFDPPDDGDWVRVSMKETGSQQETLGRVTNRRFKRTGIVFVQIYSMRDKGVKIADGHGERVREILEGKTIGGVNFIDLRVRNLDPEGNHLVSLGEANFFYEQKK